MPPAFSTFHLSSAFLSIFPGHFSLQLGDWDICLPIHREMFCLRPASLPGIAFRTLTNCKHYNLIFSLRWARYIYLSPFYWRRNWHSKWFSEFPKKHRASNSGRRKTHYSMLFSLMFFILFLAWHSKPIIGNTANPLRQNSALVIQNSHSNTYP